MGQQRSVILVALDSDKGRGEKDRRYKAGKTTLSVEQWHKMTTD